MLTPRQKIHVATLGVALFSQAIVLTKLTSEAFTLENQRKALVDVLNKHRHVLDDIDRQKLLRTDLKQVS